MAGPRAAAASVSRVEARQPSLRTTRRICWNCMGSVWARWRERSRIGPGNIPGIMPRMRRRTPLTLLIVFLVSLPCFAQTKAEENVASSPDYSKEAFVVERYHTRVTSESDGSGVRELTSEVKILADSGVKDFAGWNFT